MSQVYSHYIKVLLEHAERIGLSAEDLLSQINLPRPKFENNALIDAEYHNNLVRMLWKETNDECMQFTPTPVKRGIFHASCKLALHEDTLERGLRETLGLYALATNDLKMHIRSTAESAVIEVCLNSAGRDPNHYMDDFMICIWHRFASWLIGCQIPMSAIRLPFKQPISLPNYHRVFNAELHFSQPRLEIEFPAKYLSFKIIRSISELHDFVKHSPRELIELPSGTKSVENQVKALIASLSREKLVLPPFESIAEQLNVSVQTLRRRLSEEGSSYRNIKDILRRDYCIEKLTRTSLSIAEIAFQVGFSEPAALTRAFKGWSGVSPNQYRITHFK